jgi:hypothetical protein
MADHETTLRAYVSQLEGLVRDLQEITEESQAILVAHRRSGGLTRAEVIEQLLELLDGDGWRRTELSRTRICADCRGGSSYSERLKAIKRKVQRSRLKQRETAADFHDRKATAAKRRKRPVNTSAS